MKKVISLALFLGFIHYFLFAQSVGIGTVIPDPKSQLDITSSSKGLLIPRLTTTQRVGIINPPKGLMVYDSSAQYFFYHDGTTWQLLAAASKTWAINGNTGTNPAINFIGTIDDQPLKFRLNNIPAGQISKLNVFIGFDAGSANVSFGNVGIGRAVLKNIGEAYSNVGIGDSVMFNTGSSANTAIGYRALRFLEYGSQNTAVGFEALFSSKDSYNNTAIGYMALRSNVGYDNTSVGYQALKENINGAANTAIGTNTLRTNQNGYSNTAIGMYALEVNSSGNNNTAVGYQALQSSTNINNNTAVGTQALQWNLASGNTAVGFQALLNNSTGGGNVAIGEGSLMNNITGHNNTALGYLALKNNVAALYNTAVGTQALYHNIGSSTEGWENTAVGWGSLSNNISGMSNTAVGVSSLEYNQAGSYNTAFGEYGLSHINGSYNTSLGFSAGSSAPFSLNNFTAVGYEAGHSYSVSNSVEIGNRYVTWIGGQVGWSTYSDERIKQNIKEDVPGLAFIDQLRPVTYNINSNKQHEMMYGDTDEKHQWEDKYNIEKIRMTGFIAQEVEQAAKECEYDFHGVIKPKNPDGLYSLTYSEFVMPLVKAVQELHAQNSELKKRIEILEKMIMELNEKK